MSALVWFLVLVFPAAALGRALGAAIADIAYERQRAQRARAWALTHSNDPLVDFTQPLWSDLIPS